MKHHALVQYELWLLATGPNKISLIKEVRGLTGFGLKEAKDLVEAGGLIRTVADEGQAEREANILRGTGAQVEVRPTFSHRWFVYDPTRGTDQEIVRIGIAEPKVEVKKMRFGEAGSSQWLQSPTVEAAREYAVLEVARLRAKGWEIATRELDAFLAVSRRSPDLAEGDDTSARQVYADWLLENGDVRGELIHLSIAEASTNEWLVKNLGAVLGPLARCRLQLRLRWDRGWIDSMELAASGALSNQETAEAIAKVPALERLRTLAISGAMLPELALVPLPPTCRTLRVIDSSYFSLDHAPVNELAKRVDQFAVDSFWLRPLQLSADRLKSLAIRSSDVGMAVSMLEAAELPALERLHLMHRELGYHPDPPQYDWTRLLERPFRSLRELTLEDLSIDLRAVFESRAGRGLEVLRLCGSTSSEARDQLSHQRAPIEVVLVDGASDTVREWNM